MESIKTNKGDCITLNAVWRNGAGEPVDLTNLTVEVIEASPEVIRLAAVTVVDAEAGEFRVRMDTDIADALRPGAQNWFRLAVVGANGCRDTTPRIGINVV